MSESNTITVSRMNEPTLKHQTETRESNEMAHMDAPNQHEIQSSVFPIEPIPPATSDPSIHSDESSNRIDENTKVKDFSDEATKQEMVVDISSQTELSSTVEESRLSPTQFAMVEKIASRDTTTMIGDDASSSTYDAAHVDGSSSTSLADSSARSAAYSDDALNARTRDSFKGVRKRKVKKGGPIDPKLQAMLDSYARDQEAAASANSYRAVHSHSSMRETHKQVIIDGKMTYRPMTDIERMQHALAKNVGGATFEADATSSPASSSSTRSTSSAPNIVNADAFQQMIDATAPSKGTTVADTTSISDPSIASSLPSTYFDFHAFVDLDVNAEGDASTQIVLMDRYKIESLLQERSSPAVADAVDETDDEDADDSETSLVDLMAADSELEMKGGGKVHTLEAFRKEQEAIAAAIAAQATKPLPPSVLVLVDTYLTQFDKNPIGFLMWLQGFEFSPEALLQWFMLIPKIAERKKAKLEAAEKQLALERSNSGNIHHLSLASTTGRFQRASASSDVRDASSAILPRNVATMDMYDLDLRQSKLPQDYLPKGLDDMLLMSRQYGMESVLKLLEKLGHPSEEVQVIECYIETMMEIMQQQSSGHNPVKPNVNAAASSSMLPSATPALGSRTGSSTSSGSRGGIATLASMRESSSNHTSPSQPSRSWNTGAGHSLIATPSTNSPSSAISFTATNPNSSTSAGSSASAAGTLHSDPDSLVPSIPPDTPQTKLQFVLSAAPSKPITTKWRLDATLGDIRTFVAAASGLPIDSFDLVILRPKQSLTGPDTSTIQQMKLQSAKINQVIKS